MFQIINKQILAQDIKRIDVFAPNIAKKFAPGQFVSVCPEKSDERIPLSIIDADEKKGTITLIFREIGDTTGKLGSMPMHENLYSVLGPLGKGTKIEDAKVVICAATSIGTAQILPICKAYKNKGAKVIGIIGAKSKKTLLMESQMRIACNKVYIATEDGSYERKALATDILVQVINKLIEDEVNLKEVLVYAIGSIEMMSAVASFTKSKKIKTKVQLKPVMCDCLGMCGSCRVKIDGRMVNACTQGPEFDAHKVDYDEFNKRMKAFEESDKWYNQKLQLNQNSSESKILPKFLAGILKK